MVNFSEARSSGQAVLNMGCILLKNLKVQLASPHVPTKQNLGGGGQSDSGILVLCSKILFIWPGGGAARGAHVSTERERISS